MHLPFEPGSEEEAQAMRDSIAAIREAPMSASGEMIRLLSEINEQLKEQNEALNDMREIQAQEAMQSMMMMQSLLGDNSSKTEQALERYLNQGLVKDNEPGAKEALEQLSEKRKGGLGNLLG